MIAELTRGNHHGMTAIGKYRAALSARKVSAITKVSEYSLIQNSGSFTSQAPIMKPIKKVITVEEYRRRQKLRPKIIKKALAKLIQVPCEENVFLEDIAPYLFVLYQKKCFNEIGKTVKT